jgi:hypothetical protein
LRAIWSYTYTHRHCYINTNGYYDTEWNTHSNTHAERYTYWYSERNSHWNTDSNCKSKHYSASYPYSKVTSESEVATHSASSHNTGPAAAFAIPYDSTASHSSASHYTDTPSAFTAPYRASETVRCGYPIAPNRQSETEPPSPKNCTCKGNPRLGLLFLLPAV